MAASTSGEWDGAGLPEAPSAPESMKEAGLSLSFLNDLILRTLYVRGGMLGLDLARFLCLPFKVIEEALKFLKDEKCVEVAGGDLIGRVHTDGYALSGANEAGRYRHARGSASMLQETTPIHIFSL